VRCQGLCIPLIAPRRLASSEREITAKVELSDAGGAFDWEPEIRYSQSFARTLLRATDIWQYRINTHQNMLADEILLSIHDCNIKSPGSPSLSIQRLIGRIRTDFNRFSQFEYHILRNHGFSVAAATLRDIAEKCRTVRDYVGNPASLHPFVPALPTDVPLAQFNATLQKSSERRKNFFDGKDLVSWAYPVLAVMAVIASLFVLPYLASKVENLNKAIAETQRAKYPNPRLDLESAGSVGDMTDLMRSGTPIAIDSINRIITAEKSAVKGKAKYLIFVRQKGEFNGRFRTLYGQIRFDSSLSTKAVSGKAFLVDSRSDVPGAGYRELVMPVDRDGYLTSPAGVIVDSPQEHEYLVLMLVVESADEKKPFPPTLVDHEWKTLLEVR
jgi:hypothetical protein